MITSFFKPAWQSPSAEKRLKAVAEIDSSNAENQKILADLARDDQDLSIRRAAIERLTEVEVLHELSKKKSEDDIQCLADQRLNELLSTGDALSEDNCRDLLQQYPDMQVRFAAFADSASIRRHALKHLSATQLLEVLSMTTFTDSRQHIADELSEIDNLEYARKILRGKDKNAERTIKVKIDAVRTHQRQQAENKARLEKLIEDAEYLAGHEWLPEFKSRSVVHRQQWDSLDFDVDENDRLRYQAARDVIDAQLEQQRVIEETRQSQERLYDELEVLIHSASQKSLVELIEVEATTQTQRQQIDTSWQALSRTCPPDEAISDQFETTGNALQVLFQFATDSSELMQNVEENPAHSIRQLDVVLKKLKWPAGFTEPQVRSEIKQRLSEWRKSQQVCADEHQHKLDRVHKEISSIFRFSRAGNLARATRHAAKVEKALGAFEGRDLSALKERFDEATKTLGDMGDWKNFATEPKYLELCEAMEKLIDSGLHPDKQSAQMKKLQQQWKELGHSDISDQYWTRFKLAADKVYQPCTEFFEQRRIARKANLDKRQLVVEQMRELLEATAWDDSPDYKEAQSRLHSINSNFIGIKDVEHRVGQKQWQKFSTLKDAVMAKLGSAYDDNIVLKQRLIEQAESLAEAAAVEENLTRLKLLQTRWKQVGITRRKQDQKAWVIFKKHCDLVYEKAQLLRKDKREENNQQLTAYREIIKSLQTLVKSADNLSEADQRFSELQVEFDALPELPQELPEKLLGAIHRDYRNVCGQFEKRHTQLIKQKQNKKLEALRQKAELCAQQEALGVSATEQQILELSRRWDSIELLDAEFCRRIEARRSSAQSDIDRDAIAADRRMLCIRLEIALDVESPLEDRGLRMQYQLEQMNKSGLGQQAAVGKDMIADMELDWLCMSGAGSDLQKALDKRFQRVLGSAR